jgi:hypothetical protein
VLETRVLSFSVFTDDGKVDILVSGWDTGEGLANDNGSVNVESLTHGDVPRVVTVLVERGGEDT